MKHTNRRLDTYLQTARSSAVAATLRQRLANWPVYAAATGSALAMATTASAATVSFSGAPVTVSVAGGSGVSSQTVAFPAGHSFQLQLNRDNITNTSTGGHFQGGGASLNGGFRTDSLDFLVTSAGMAPKVLHSGSLVSSAGKFAPGDQRIAYKNLLNGSTLVNAATNPNTPEFIGFRFNVGTPSVPSYDYGYLELEYGVESTHGIPDTLTLLAAAYNDDQTAILTPTPEPASAGLMFLALGAAGVTALRRRREQAAQ